MAPSHRKGVFRLPEDIHAWNVDGSSTDQLLSCSWIEYWEKETGLQRGKCSYKDCKKAADHGGHIWLKRKGVFIAPICRGCNYSLNAKRQQNIDGNHSFLRKGTTVVKSEITPDMKSAERRFAIATESVQQQEERTCTECETIISNLPKHYYMCLSCYSRSRNSKKRGQEDSSAVFQSVIEDEDDEEEERICTECETIISHLPKHYYMCLKCYRTKKNSKIHQRYAFQYVYEDG